MGYRLRFDGINDYCQFSNAVNCNVGTDAWSIEIVASFSSVSSSGSCVLGGALNSANDGFLLTSAGRLSVMTSSANRIVSNTGFVIFDSTVRTYRLEHDASGSFRFYRDGELFQSGTFTGSLTFNGGLGVIGKYRPNVEWYIGMDLERITLTGFTNSAEWQANLSGGSGTTLPTTSGTNQATLINFPTDNSQWVFYSTGGTTYTLTATGATYSYSGGTATTAYNRVMQAAGGSFSYAGGATTLTYSPAGVVYTLSADGGVYSYSGSNATTAYNRVMAASGGAFAYSGGNATLSRNYSVAASGGVYNHSGGNASLNYTPSTGYRLTALGASFGYAGGEATFTYSQTYPQASASDFTVSGRLSESVSYSAIMYESTTYSGRLN